MSMTIDDIKLVCRAIEMAYHGVDIDKVTDFSQYYNPAKGKFQTKASPLTKPITIKLDKDVMDYIQAVFSDHVIRSGPTSAFFSYEDALLESEKECILNVSLNVFKKTMCILFKNNITAFSGINPTSFDTEFAERIEKERTSFDYTATPDVSMMKSLSREAVKQNFEVLLSICQYPKKVAELMLKQYYEDDEDFLIDAFKDFEIIDNRIYIPLSAYDINTYQQNYTNNRLKIPHELGLTKYIVISRNPYDYYFCSYGSSIQSCFSLTSEYNGGYGMYPMCTQPGHFIVYGTDGKSNQCNIIDGKKWDVPHMTFRCWGWLGEDNELLCDRFYVGSGGDETDFRRHFYPILEKHLNVSAERLRDNASNLKYPEVYNQYHKDYGLQVYLDSVDFTNSRGKFRQYGGIRGCIGRVKPAYKKMSDVLKTITTIPDTFKYSDNYAIVKGVLTIAKKCPITGLLICEDESKSFYSKFYKEPVEDLTVVTYCDGMVWLSDTTLRKNHQPANDDPIKVVPSNQTMVSKLDGKVLWLTQMATDPYHHTSLTVFKNTLKEIIQKSESVHNILLRVIEQDRVNYIKYRG